MSKVKNVSEISNKDFCEIGEKIALSQKLFVEAWQLSMKKMKLTSREYKAICKAGKNIQKAYDIFHIEAFDRNDKEVDKVFGNHQHCFFN